MVFDLDGLGPGTSVLVTSMQCKPQRHFNYNNSTNVYMSLNFTAGHVKHYKAVYAVFCRKLIVKENHISKSRSKPSQRD